MLNKALWGIEWFMLADGDAQAMTNGDRNAAADSKNRLRILPRYHLENYFLDEEIWVQVFEHLEEEPGSWLRNPSLIRRSIRETAESFTSYGVALCVSHRFRQEFGNVDVMPKSCHKVSKIDLINAFIEGFQKEKNRFSSCLDIANALTMIDEEYSSIEKSFREDTDEWKAFIPGRPVLASFASSCRIDLARLKRIYVKCGLNHPKDPFGDIRKIFRHFSTFT